jgi:hypothetical protein
MGSMMVKLENLTGRLVSVRLNSGRTLHLQPRMLSDAVSEAQVTNNSDVEKLQERQIIAVRPGEERGKQRSTGEQSGGKATSVKARSSGPSKKEE